TLVENLRAKRSGVVSTSDMLPRPEVIQMLSESTVFVCPSIYEPFGIVTVEAMGTGTAVVASAVGGIKEVVVDGETGRLVHYLGDSQGNPLDREKFARDFAQSVNEVATDRALAERYGSAGRERVLQKFGWTQVAQDTVKLYEEVAR